MRNLLLALSAAMIVGLAFWAYRENYRTQGEVAELRALQTEIGQLKEGLGVLDAEWAYLNRPDRLRELADANFARLKLLPLAPEQFGDVAQVPYPPEGGVEGAVEVPAAEGAVPSSAAEAPAVDPAVPAPAAEVAVPPSVAEAAKAPDAAAPPKAAPKKAAPKKAAKSAAPDAATDALAGTDPVLAATLAALEATP